MKKLLTLALSLIITLSVAQTTATAQTAKEVRKETRALKVKDKELDKKLKANSLKEARKAAKKLTKEGFSVQPGALPLDKQIEQSWKYAFETDAEGIRVYILASQNAVGGTYSAAKTQALALARNELAGQIASEIAELIKTEIMNEAITEDEVATIVNTVSASKQKISQKLGRIIQVVEVSRKNKKTTEINLTVAYNTKSAIKIVKEEILQDLENVAGELADELDEIL